MILCFPTDSCWANIVDPDHTALSDQKEQSDHGQQVFLFNMHLLGAFFYGKTTLFKFKDDYMATFLLSAFSGFYG